jgi:uncharacterized membrane protein
MPWYPTPIVAGFAVAIIGASVAGIYNWPAFAVYLIGFAAIFVFFAVLAYVEHGAPKRRSRTDSRT